MPKERPVVVLVFAILNIVFGSLGSLCSGCNGVMVGFAQGMLSAAGPGMRIPPIPSDVMVISIAEYVIEFCLSVPLIFAGIGLLGMKVWARRLSIALSVCGILLSLVSPAITIGYKNPRMEKWQKELQEQLARGQQGRGMQQPPNFYQPPQMEALQTIGALMVPTLLMAYAIALLVVMFLPQVTAAFAGRPIQRRLDWDREPDDERSEEYEG